MAQNCLDALSPPLPQLIPCFHKMRLPTHCSLGHLSRPLFYFFFFFNLEYSLLSPHVLFSKFNVSFNVLCVILGKLCNIPQMLHTQIPHFKKHPVNLGSYPRPSPALSLYVLLFLLLVSVYCVLTAGKPCLFSSPLVEMFLT